jgi:hypothetical protein
MEEGTVDGKQMFVTDQHAAELTEPSVGAFNLPAPFVASQFPAILVSPFFVDSEAEPTCETSSTSHFPKM